MKPDIVHVENRLMSREESRLLLQQCLVGRIGTVDNDGVPYVTPVNYTYESDLNRIYIHHSSKEGHLLNNLKVSNCVCFEIDQPDEIVNVSPGMHICNGDQIYRSVICFGRMLVVDSEEKSRGLRLLGSKYSGQSVLGQTGEFEPAKLDRLVVLAINIETMTGKCRGSQAWQ
jgi:nitroimidazol reductase NimA-like FMN-containing flavoprotein (pyridoxamine 5'-phosphate oxidase superfamily)